MGDPVVDGLTREPECVCGPEQSRRRVNRLPDERPTSRVARGATAESSRGTGGAGVRNRPTRIEWREARNGKHSINSLGRLRAIRRGGALRLARQDATTRRRQARKNEMSASWRSRRHRVRIGSMTTPRIVPVGKGPAGGELGDVATSPPATGSIKKSGT